VQQLRERLRSLNLRFVEEPGARALQRIGFTPNAVTLLGFLVTCVAAVLVAMGHLRIGALVFLAGGALDLFDGALARLSNKTTPFGAMLDSLMDRLGEAALYLGLTVYALRVDPDSRNLTLFMSLLILALATSQAVSYLRAKGESLGIDTRAGLMTRPERVIILFVGLFLGEATILLAMGFIAFFSTWTMLTRLIHIYRHQPS
jgi:CDP-diacylglycerol--glycerol-3-phosphate 3-phosphatidyltransferase